MVIFRENTKLAFNNFEFLKDETKLDKWRPIAVKAVEKQDFSEVREHVQAYCGQQNMVCFYDEQYCILAQNLAGKMLCCYHIMH